MNYPRRPSVEVLSFLILVLASAAAFAAPSLALLPGSRLWLTGTSTLHPYSSSSTLTQISADLAPDAVAQATGPVEAVLADLAHRAPFQHFEVVIPVKGLKSGESGLDRNMYKALKAEKAPDIHFTLIRYEAAAPTPDGSIPFNAAGRLSIAGVEKDISLSGTARPAAEVLVMDGDYQLLMSNYGVKPPTLMFGAIKVADQVVIHFHLPFTLSSSETSTSPKNMERGLQ